MLERTGQAPIASALASLAVLCVLSWPLPLYLEDWHLHTMFGDSHVWVMDHVVDRILHANLSGSTSQAGYPQTWGMAVIGWGPLLATLPLRLLLSPLGAANLVQLLSLPLSALAATLLFRRFTEASPVIAAALGAAWSLSPTLLSTYGMGEISNTQAWILPGFLLLADLALARPRWLLALAAFTTLSLFSSPYFGMALPLLGGGLALLRLLRPLDPLPLRGRLVRTLLLGVALGLAALPARAYFGQHQQADHAQRELFRPARHSPVSRGVPDPSPVARPKTLLYEGPATPKTSHDPLHTCYLGLGLLGVGLALGAWGPARRARGYPLGLALALGGVTLALGPRLVLDTQYVRWGEDFVYLPVAWLEALGYPTRDGGMYFRYSAIATLGLALAAAAGLSAVPRGSWLALLLAAVQVTDSVRATGPLWPRPGEPVPGRAAMAALSGEDGAVLELPLQGPADLRYGQDALLRAVFHGRPTSAMPRDVMPTESELPILLTRALQSGQPREALRRLGFRYVVLPAARQEALSAGEVALLAQLGAAGGDQAFLVWDLGPTTLSPLTGS